MSHSKSGDAYAHDTTICSGIDMTSASTSTVLSSWMTRVPGAASPSTVTVTSTLSLPNSAGIAQVELPSGGMNAAPPTNKSFAAK